MSRRLRVASRGRTAAPVSEHFAPGNPTWTEKALGRLSRDV